MASQTHVSNLLVRALVEVVQRRGIAPDAWLGDGESRCGVADAWVPLDEYQALFARAIQLTEDPALGLHCGLSATESSFGLMSPLVSHAASLRDGIQLIAQFYGLMVEDARVELSECMGSARLCVNIYAPTDRSVTELLISGLVRMLRAFGCADDEIHAVRFAHQRPVYYHRYAVAFRGAERFAQAFTGIEFAARALDRPHIHREPELQALMRAQAERGLQRRSRPLTCAERVRVLMRHRADAHAVDMAFASRELGISIRSLRRRLEEEGTSYRALMQSLLYESACSMLRNPDLTLQAIAAALGFAEASTFHRAFRRWAGLTPAEYREAMKRSASQRSARRMIVS